MNNHTSVIEPGATLPHAYVAQAPEGPLDPNDLKGRPAVVVIPAWPGIDYPDHVYMQWTDAQGSYDDDLPIYRGWPAQEPVKFDVPLAMVLRGLGSTITLRYQVHRGSTVMEGEDWPLEIREGFVAAVEVDLAAHNHVVFDGKLAPQVPAFATFHRPATWGVAPYSWSSSAEWVAQVDGSGIVTLASNGTTTITAQDAQGTEQQFDLTVKGIVSLHFLSPSADWQGMVGACNAAQLSPVTRVQMGHAWRLYYPQTGPIADWLQWLPYPVWLGDTAGAGTALAYNLNGAPNATGGDNDNVLSFTTDTHLQVLGARP